ncbi:MAG TPA: PfkB family carbohydrate kinase [Microbacteriaceae bacterium]|nr:PfkB family carbohydrate kinase [Microbacteriaceae bacterium]
MVLDCLCIGGAAADGSFHLTSPAVLGTSNVATAESGFGGVARNVAESLARLGARVSLLSAVGADASGWELIEHATAAGIDAGLVQVVPGEQTSRYIALIDPDGELVIGINAMGVLARIRPSDIADAPLDEARWVFAECNLDAETLLAVIERRREGGAFRLAIDAISTPKAQRLPADLTGIDLLCGNVDEANAILGRSEPGTPDGARSLARGLVARGAGAAMISIGPGGCVVATPDDAWVISAVPADVVDVTGAGDARIAGTIHALLDGEPIHQAARRGSLLAAIAAESPTTIDAALGPQRLAASSNRLAEATVSRLTPEGPLP